MVAASLVRELGPVVTALLYAGRAGSAMSAEIGLMKATEQLSGLEMMAVNPEHRVLTPRLIAGIISMPLLAAMFSVLGVYGGWFVGVVLFGVSEAAYFQGMYETVEWKDVQMGVVKSFVFGLLIVWISTAQGFFLHLDRSGVFGAEGVSRATTNAVVFSTISVLVSDYLISAMMV